MPTGLFKALEAIKQGSPRVLTVSVDVRADTFPQAVREGYVDQYRDDFKDLLERLPNLLVVVAAGNEKQYATPAAYRVQSNAGLMRAALLLLREDPLFANRILVAAGTKPGNSFWDTNIFNNAEGSNSFTNVTDIGAPAHNVLVMDTLAFGQVPTYASVGTSLSAPMVAGAAALLLSMDSLLSAAEVKDYILRGAQVPRNDTITGSAVAPNPVQGVPNGSFYQLDLYGSLTLLSKERPGAPVCGYPVGSGPYTSLVRYRNGPLSPWTDSSSVPKVGSLYMGGIFSIAPGGRQMAVGTPYDSLTGAAGTVVVRPDGQRIQSLAGVRRIYLERDIVDYRPGNGTATRLRPGSPNVTMSFTDENGNPIIAGPWNVSASPDGRFLTYAGVSSASSGAFAKRFSDQGIEKVHQCVGPGNNCPYTTVMWNRDGRRFFVATGDYTIGNQGSLGILPFTVSVTTQANAFSAGAIVPIGVSFAFLTVSGDDALLVNQEAGSLVKRPLGALGTVAGSTPTNGWLLPNFGNVIGQ